MTDDLINVFRREITPEIAGIFWFSSDSLQKRPEPFYALDYLFDGLLTNSLNDQANSDKMSGSKNFFYTTSFGKPFFLFQLHKQNSNASNNEIKDVLSMLISKIDYKQTILVIDNAEKKSFEFLQQKFSEFNFRSIEIN